MARKSLKTATHRYVANCVVQFAKTKDFLGAEMFYVIFKNGETTTMSAHRFNELFAIN